MSLFLYGLGGALLAGSLTTSLAAQQTVSVDHVQRMPNSANPELLYWFITPEMLQGKTYLHQVDAIAAQGTFGFVFLTARNGEDFYDAAKLTPIFKDLVAEAHRKGLKVGLQLWAKETDLPASQMQGLVSEHELTLDAQGNGETTGRLRGIRMTHPVDYLDQPGDAQPVYKANRSELLRVYAFRKAGDGAYVPGSVVDLTTQTTAESSDPASVHVSIHASPKLAGYTAYVMTLHYAAFPDLFSPFLPDAFASALRAYRDVGFDGSALDEFKYITVGKGNKEPFRERFYTPAMGTRFYARTGKDLVRTLFDMRYSPAGDPTPRIWAINRYFDLLRQGPLRIEEQFYADANRTLGAHTFHGIHDTWHNALENDEIWGTGINWWAVPREYGQTDEFTPMTTRLGIAMAHAQPVEYNQYYTKDLKRFEEEGFDDARYNTRVHYHAWNDQHFGVDLADAVVHDALGRVEDKVRLLNAFDAPRPATNVLFLFGFPSLTNWFQKDGLRNDWDINGAMQAEQKAVAAWQAGYRGPLAPSYLIDDGIITADDHGGILYGGHRYTALVFIGPEYSTDATLKLLARYTQGGGRVLLDGTATRNIDAADIRSKFAPIAAKAVATTFSIEAMAKLGQPKLAMDGGASFEDGSVVLTDTDSWLTGTPKPFQLSLNGHKFTGSFIGLLAIKADAGGRLIKLGAGALRKLDRDGEPIVQLSAPSDVVLRRSPNGSYHATVVGDATLAVH
jgi:hypothetical protein